MSKHEMPPLKKKAKTMASRGEEKAEESGIHADFRIAWLFASEDAFVEIKAKEERFRVHKKVLSRHSEYFKKCFNEPFKEASERLVSFDDIEPQYMAYYIGVAYSWSTIVPHGPLVLFIPDSTQSPTLRDYIEVYKLCDRFLSEDMGNFMKLCIKTTINKRHSALNISSEDEARQKALMREFADGYEALETMDEAQKRLATEIIDRFCDNINYQMWDKGSDDLEDRPRFVNMVSKGFARRLAEVQSKKGAKSKRKGPAGS